MIGDSLEICARKGTPTAREETEKRAPMGSHIATSSALSLPDGLAEIMNPGDVPPVPEGEMSPPPAKQRKFVCEPDDNPHPLRFAMGAVRTARDLGLRNPETEKIFTSKTLFCEYFGLPPPVGDAKLSTCKYKLVCKPDKEHLNAVLDCLFGEGGFNFRLFFVLMQAAGYDKQPHSRKGENKLVVAMRNCVEGKTLFTRKNKKLFKVLSTMHSMREFVDDVFDRDMWDRFENKRFENRPLTFALTVPLWEDYIAALYDRKKNLIGSVEIIDRSTFKMAFKRLDGKFTPFDEFSELRSLV